MIQRGGCLGGRSLYCLVCSDALPKKSIYHINPSFAHFLNEAAENKSKEETLDLPFFFFCLKSTFPRKLL